jgi:hypothetical protein
MCIKRDEDNGLAANIIRAIARELPNFEYGPLKLNYMSAAYLIDNNQS